MGYHCEGAGLVTAAEAYWLGRGDMPPPNKVEALAALDVITRWIRKVMRQFETGRPEDLSPASAVGRLICIAFEATPEEIASYQGRGQLWWDGAFNRFLFHFELHGGLDYYPDDPDRNFFIEGMPELPGIHFPGKPKSPRPRKPKSPKARNP